jgi:hypothetical protein
LIFVILTFPSEILTLTIILSQIILIVHGWAVFGTALNFTNNSNADHQGAFDEIDSIFADHRMDSNVEFQLFFFYEPG